jgi:hypothetical protein
VRASLPSICRAPGHPTPAELSAIVMVRLATIPITLRFAQQLITFPGAAGRQDLPPGGRWKQRRSAEWNVHRFSSSLSRWQTGNPDPRSARLEYYIEIQKFFVEIVRLVQRENSHAAGNKHTSAHGGGSTPSKETLSELVNRKSDSDRTGPKTPPRKP